MTDRPGTSEYADTHHALSPDGARTTERRTAAYRAYTRAALTRLATAAKPVMTAHSPA